MKESVVVIPTYNEIENIEAIIRKVFSLPYPFHLLIVDDSSPDGTAEAVHRLQTEYPDRLFLEQRRGKLGLGTAYIHGFKYALNAGYQYIFEMDADFSHNPKDLIKLHDACAVDGYDLAIGSRYSSGVNVVNWPMSRVLLSYFASRYVRFITGMPIHDATAGFKCYSRKVLETINLDKIRFIGYAFQIEMKFLTYKFGFKIKEVPIIFTDRTKGQSKMSKGIIKEAFLGVIQMKVASYFRHFAR
ncbi:polyprenol monophosphomannose synthase [Rufibacter tibetensis]|uniref:Dolichyl-phosphate beta-D-mannosyltransferase n=1 Tax=Rufibacter tibetensis TaxID=512763 RepID=A0A0P0C0A9_9BACT|nr:polyprenol monophosphomannose synthase [Rufibacter tibetensis]ALI97918.1 dolichyl-phosphate beta-D-mannosyltransferase [Rufibacter tibetensis]